jgi:hypothetical protein
MGIFLAGHAGDPYPVTRVKRAPIMLERPHVSIALTTQPANVEGLYGNRLASGRGMLARFLVSVAESKMGTRKIDAPAIPAELKAIWARTISFLMDAEFTLGSPQLIAPSHGASKLLREFREEVERQLVDDGEFGDRLAFGSKFPGAVARIATVYHGWIAGVSGNLRMLTDEIHRDTVAAAIEAGMWFAEQERHVGQVLGIDDDTANAKKIVAWIRRNRLTGFSRRDAFTQNRDQRIRKVEDINSAIDLLIETSHIRPLPEQRGKGRRQSPEYQVNPALLRPGGG